MASENSINNLFISTDFSYINNISKRIRDWCLSYGYIELKLDDFLKMNDIKKVSDSFPNINKDYIIFDNKKEKFILRPEPNISVIEKLNDLSKNLAEDINYKFFCFVNSIRIFVEKGSNYSNSKYRLNTCINREKMITISEFYSL